MHGKGSRSYSNGSKYIGGFRDGEPHGEGICMYINGDQYIGEWANGFQTGRGDDHVLNFIPSSVRVYLDNATLSRFRPFWCRLRHFQQ